MSGCWTTPWRPRTGPASSAWWRARAGRCRCCTCRACSRWPSLTVWPMGPRSRGRAARVRPTPHPGHGSRRAWCCLPMLLYAEGCAYFCDCVAQQRRQAAWALAEGQVKRAQAPARRRPSLPRRSASCAWSASGGRQPATRWPPAGSRCCSRCWPTTACWPTAPLTRAAGASACAACCSPARAPGAARPRAALRAAPARAWCALTAWARATALHTGAAPSCGAAITLADPGRRPPRSAGLARAA